MLSKIIRKQLRQMVQTDMPESIVKMVGLYFNLSCVQIIALS